MSFIADSNAIAEKLRARRKPKRTLKAPDGPFMKLEEIQQIIPLSKSQLYLQMQQGKFPRPIKLGERTAAWRRSDVEAWINAKLA